MPKTKIQQISGWGNYPRQKCQLLRPEKYQSLYPDFIFQSCIARGQGRSYGDASLNNDIDNHSHFVILTERLNRFISFDQKKGVIKAEAGVTLKEILEVIIPRGWFLPVTPGTQFVSLGGCVATDVHGKNHHHAGSFGQYILELELITAENHLFTCSPHQHPDIFWSTIGGMGLTGIIGNITLQLIPLSSTQMITRYYTAHSLSELFDYLNNEKHDDIYSVAWIDTYAQRGILMTAHHASQEEINEFTTSPIADAHLKSFIKTIPGFLSYLPHGLVSHWNIHLFNQFYFKTQARKTASFMTNYQSFFYPLDSFLHWNRLYGKNGFVQYQCVFPDQNAFEGIQKILNKKCSSFLSVLKRFGHGNTNSPLSFPIKGYTLALDIPYKGQQTIDLIKAFNQILLTYHGRVYLAKDALLSPEEFQKMYPAIDQFLTVKQKIDPQNMFQSTLSRRLNLYATQK